jgi:drug/metabolite transporter (DMT)-like permease
MAKARLQFDTPVLSRAAVSTTPQAALAKIILAFAAVYIVWGSTYLAIKYAIGTLPPFLMASTRFLIAGAILFGWGMFRDRKSVTTCKPTFKQWRRALLIGALLLLGGNGGVTWAEGYLSSGFAALLIASEPLMVVLLNWFTGGSKPNAKVTLGLFTGLAGVALLVSGAFSGGTANKSMSLIAAGVVIAASLSWAGGSIASIRRPVQTSPSVASGMQMLCGGVLLFLMGIVHGDFARLDLKQASLASIAAFLYLIVFGSIVAFTAYSWLLRNVSPARAATYAYVNPVVAVLLGWAIASEPVTLRMLLAAAIIVASVALITTYGKDQQTEMVAPPTEPDDTDPCPTLPCA